ncbi:hypothetical protein BCV69DRAFT_113965 [Microstroma glucosiphilum]|uniref:DNA/RNA-binding domain-containing protein n=1 Tax=Pseudomicrostroma glucosiphilum TaxID=1684307 RepID=A0A316UFW8_9BASI|nr:hypothetical protein BCV69DRAFT_113965 [Pseudomicrostroma glucosiphilum]PWN23271.1 hypothetical protein BCV69DRAFT_113965 [Pseudomicrostroma glucosiphilum]
MAPPKSESASQSSSDSEAAAAAAPALQTSARSSSVSLKALKRQLAEQLSQRNVTLAPTLSTDLAFTRNQVRNAYLRLLFHAPFTKSAHQAELGLWNETTHRVVGVYRGRLSKLEKEMKEQQQQQQQQQSASRPSTPAKDDTKAAGPSATKRKAQSQEYSKLSEALRQLLAKEEAFWKGLAERMANVFRLAETQPALERAGLTTSGQKIPIGPRAIVGEGGQPAGLARLPNTPAELDPAVLQMANLPRHKERLIEIVHRALVYCGDLARYREIYREPSNSSPSRKGPTSGHRGGGRKAATVPISPNPQQRNFEDAIACYEAARLLVPSSGNPSNQLAVVSAYCGDVFGAVYHYYRALCVKVPFESAKINLGTSLGKAVTEWAKDGGLEASSEADGSGSARPLSDEKRKQSCLKTYIALQGLFYTRKSFISLQPLSAQFHQTFQAAVADRILPTDVIVRIFVTSVAASWTARLWRKSDSNGSQKVEASETGAGNLREDAQSLALNVELQLLDHVLSTAQALFDIATTQSRIALENASLPPSGTGSKGAARDGQSPATKNLTPVMRRVLPATRIASKWIKSHLDYIDRSQQTCISKAAEGFASVKGSSNNAEAVACAAAELSLIQRVEDFWASFVIFTNTLRYAFPFDALPSLGTVRPTGAAPLSLEEDTDLRGFIPTRRGMLTQDDKPINPADRALHPNEEQLMRIADLLVDAKVIAESEASPIVFDDAKGTFRMAPAKDGLHPKAGPTLLQGNNVNGLEAKLLSSSLGDGDDTVSIGTSEATEDVVDLAMRAREGAEDFTDDADASEDEDEILIPAAVHNRQLQYAQQFQAQGASTPGSQGIGNTPTSLASFQPAPPQQSAQSAIYAPPSTTTASTFGGPREGLAASTTAQDLFLQMLNGRPTPQSASANLSGFATPPAREVSNGTPVAPSLSRAPSATGSPHHAQGFSMTPQSQFLFGGGLGGGASQPVHTPTHQSMAGLASIWSPGPGEVRHQHHASLQSSPRASSTGDGIWNAAPGSGTSTSAGFGTPSTMQMQQQQQQGQHLRQSQQWQASPLQHAAAVERPMGPGWPNQQRG